MDKPGSVDIIAGGLWIVAGLVSIFVTAMLLNVLSLWSFVVIGIGVVQMSRGFTRRFPHTFRNEADLRAESEVAKSESMMRALIFTAAERGRLSTEASARVDSLLYEHRQTAPIPEVKAPIAERGYDVPIFLQRHAAVMPRDWRDKIIAACETLAADPASGEGASGRLAEVRAALAAG